MKRQLEILKVIIACVLITTFYAIVNDQIAFSISKDFFYRYLFYQYGIAHVGELWIPEFPRFEVFKLSLLTSWWIGIILGLVTAFVAFADRSKLVQLKDFKHTILYALLLSICITTIGALIGSVVDFSYISSSVLQELETDVVIHQKFLIASYMDKFSYIGVTLSGIFASIHIYRIRKQKQPIVPLD